MNTQTSDCEARGSFCESREEFLGKLVFISQLAIIVLVAALAAVSIWTLFNMG